MQRHMTDIVRAIRYDEVSLDEAHARLAPLMETLRARQSGGRR